MTCPNKKDTSFIKLSEIYGEQVATYLYFENNEKTPTPRQAKVLLRGMQVQKSDLLSSLSEISKRVTGLQLSFLDKNSWNFDPAAKAATDGTTVYINTDMANSTDAWHEYSHIWARNLKNNSEQDYKDLMELSATSPYMAQIRQKYPELSGTALEEEAFAYHMGKVFDNSYKSGQQNNFLQKLVAWVKEKMNSFFGTVFPKDSITEEYFEASLAAMVQEKGDTVLKKGIRPFKTALKFSRDYNASFGSVTSILNRLDRGLKLTEDGKYYTKGKKKFMRTTDIVEDKSLMSLLGEKIYYFDRSGQNYRDSQLKKFQAANDTLRTNDPAAYAQKEQDFLAKVDNDLKIKKSANKKGTAMHFLLENLFSQDDLLSRKVFDINTLDDIDQLYFYNLTSSVDRTAIYKQLRKAQAIKELTPEQISTSSIIDKAITTSNGIKRNILSRYVGKQVMIKPEQKLHSEGISPAAQIELGSSGAVDGFGGMADLVITYKEIDSFSEEVQLDTYDYYFSLKAVDNWNDVKKRNIYVQQAMYKELLQSAEVNNEKIGVSNSFMLPVTMSMEIDDATGEALLTDLGGVSSDSVLPIDDEVEVMQRKLQMLLKRGASAKPPQTGNNAIWEVMHSFFNKKAPDKVEVSDAEVEQEIERLTDQRSNAEADQDMFWDSVSDILKKKKRKINFDNVKDVLLKKKRMPVRLADTFASYYTASAKGETAPFSRWNLGEGQRNEIERLVDFFKRDFSLIEGNKVPHWEAIVNDDLRELGTVMMLNNRTKEIMMVSLADTDLTAKLDLNAKGKSILGNFYSKYDAASKGPLIEGNEKNAAFIKQALYALSINNWLKDNGYFLSSFLAVSTSEDTSHIADLPAIMAQVNKMREVKPELELLQNKYERIADYKDIIYSVFDLYSNKGASSLKYTDDWVIPKGFHNYQYYELNAFLEEQISEITRRADITRKASLPDKALEEQLRLLNNIYREIKDIRLYEDSDIPWMGNIIDRNGYFSMPSDLTQNAIVKTVDLYNSAKQKIDKLYTEEAQNTLRPMFDGLFVESYKDRYGVVLGKLQRTVVGSKSKAYLNLEQYVQNEKGEWVRTMRLRDPDNDAEYYSKRKPGQEELSKAEKDFIRKFTGALKTYQQLRGVDRLGAEFEVPLMRPVSLSATRKSLRDRMNFSNIKEVVSRQLEDAIDPEIAFSVDQGHKNALEQGVSVADFFYTSDNASRRKKTIEKTDEFETDLELILHSYFFNDVKKRSFNQILPAINSIRSSLAMGGLGIYQDYPKIKELIDDFVRNSIFGVTGKNDEDAAMHRKITPFKWLSTTAAIGASASVGLGNTFTNLWVTISATGGVYSDKYDYKELLKAAMFVGGDNMLMKNLNNTSALNHLVEYFNINDSGISTLISRMREDTEGVKNYERWAHWMNQAPDTFFRTILFLAEAQKEGALRLTSAGNIHKDSALTWNKEEGRIDYDPEKDKRFSLYLKNDPSEKAKEQGLIYDRMRQELYEEDMLTNKHEKGALPTLTRPYTYTQRYSKIKRASKIFQEMDKNNKSEFAKSAMGSLLMQFKTWMEAKIHLYWNNYYVDPHIKELKVFTDPVTGEKRADYEGRPMEGILNSLLFYMGETASMKNPVAAYGELKDFQKRNLQHGAMDVTQFALVTALASAIASAAGSEDDAQRRFASVLKFSAQDLFIGNTMHSIGSGKSMGMFTVHFYDKLIVNALGALSDPGKAVVNIGKQIGVTKELAHLADE